MTLRPFVDQPITDLAAATDLARDAADRWGLESPTLLRSGMNAIFRAGDDVLRVSSPTAPATASVELAHQLTDLGIRVTQPRRSDVVEHDGLAATVWEYIAPTSAPIDWHRVGSMVRQVHHIDPSTLPAGYPLPRPADFPWWDFAGLLAEVGAVIDEAARAGLDAAIDRWPDWQTIGSPVVCHGDVHPGNVIMSTTGPVLIDWDLLCWAPPGWDHAPMMTWADRWGGNSADYRAFAAGYGASMVGDGPADAFAELRLVAATLMRLKAGLHNEAAMPEAQRRLAYWRGDSDAPAWQAQ